MSTTKTTEVSAENLAAAQARYSAAIADGDHDEFVAAKVALVELWTGRRLSEEEIAYL